MEKKCIKAIRNSFVLTQAHKEAVCEALLQNDLSCHIVNGEVDVDLPSSYRVISIDSDFWIHFENVLILRKFSGSLYVDVYSRNDALRTLDMSLIGFILLAIVSGNDYASNVPGYGVSTNYKII